MIEFSWLEREDLIRRCMPPARMATQLVLVWHQLGLCVNWIGHGAWICLLLRLVTRVEIET